MVDLLRHDIKTPSNSIFNKLTALFLMLFVFTSSASATTYKTIPEGSYVIDMGVVPQTIQNGLRPYGLVYELLKNQGVVVEWILNPNKSKDGIDFSVDGQDFRGAPFVIDEAYRTSTVDSVLTAWEATGVIGYTTLSDVYYVPVHLTLNNPPYWVLDEDNGSLVEGAFVDAGIPITAYEFAYPSELTCCDDIFVLPHADPEWSTHRNMYNWVNSEEEGGCEGWMWAACRGGSSFENLSASDDYENHGDSLLNFLTTDGLVLAGDHSSATPPYTYNYPTDPFMQFMGDLDGALNSGSEQVYMPLKTGSWRSTTKIGVYDPNQDDIPSLSNGLAAKIAFGPAYGDTTKGMVMYEAGHNMDGGDEDENVAAQRVFLNFGFNATYRRRLGMSVADIPSVLNSGQATEMSVDFDYFGVTSADTVEWSCNCPGTFSSPDSLSTTFTPDSVETYQNCVIKARIVTTCNKVTHESKVVVVIPSDFNLVAINDTVSLNKNGSITIDQMANDTISNPTTLSLSVLTGPANGTYQIEPNNKITYLPNMDYTGSDAIEYQLCDTTNGICESAWIIIDVVPTPCGIGEAVTYYLGHAQKLYNENGIGNPERAFGVANDEGAQVKENSDRLIVNLEEVVREGSTVYFYMSCQDDVSGRINIESSATTSGFGNRVSYTDADGDKNTYERFAYTVPSGGAQYFEISSLGNKEVYLDAVDYDSTVCNSIVPIAIDDNYTVQMNVFNASFDILVNDTPNDPLGVTTNVITNPTNGTLFVNMDGNISYTPTFKFIGIDSFKYAICNSRGVCDTANVSITIVEVENCNGKRVIGGINLGGLPDYLFFFADGNDDLNFQSATKGFLGDVAVDGLQGDLRTSGNSIFAGTIYTNDSDLGAWESIIEDNEQPSINPTQAWGSTSQNSRISQLETDLANAFMQINSLSASPGYESVSATSLDGLNTQNATDETFVINVTSNFNVTSKIDITGDAGDVYILRWDDDANMNNGYQGQVRFSSGGAIVPQGGLIASNFIHVAGDINSAGGGSNPASPYPQGPRLNNGSGNLITNGTNFTGGGFFTGYWLTTGDPSDLKTQSQSNAIFVGGWYTSSIEISITGGASGINITPNPATLSTCQEICGNGIDDDFDGLIDNGDIDCMFNTVAIDDDNNTLMNMDVSGSVMTNDFDVEGNSQFFKSFLKQDGSREKLSSGSNVEGTDLLGNSVANAGTISYNANGKYTFSPSSGFSGSVTIAYFKCDDQGSCDDANLKIIVTPYSLPARIVNSVVSNNDDHVSFGNTIHGSLLGNDMDPEEDSYSISSFIVTNSQNSEVQKFKSLSNGITISGFRADDEAISNAGTFQVDGSGNYIFTPKVDFIGTVKFAYLICDDQSGNNKFCQETELTIKVLDSNGQANHRPFAGDDFAAVRMNSSVESSWKSSDYDDNQDEFHLNGFVENINVEDARSSITSYTTEQGGSITFYGDGSYAYTPLVNYYGPDQFSYQVCDVDTAAVECDSATIYFIVMPTLIDYGDLDGYASASHLISLDENGDNIPDVAEAFWLGALVDGELSTIWSSDGSGDDNDQLQDEDAFIIAEGGMVLGETSTNQVIINANQSGVTVHFGLWIDWDIDGVFDSFYTDYGVSGSPDTVDVDIAVPSSIPGGAINMRIRAFNSQPSFGDYTGFFNNGEVEDFTIGLRAAGTLLPIEMHAFTATPINNEAVQLDWSTSAEVNNDFYTVERSSDGVNWEVIGYEEGAGMSTQLLNYQFIDESPLKGNSYYRIKQTDFDGTTSNSDIRAVTLDDRKEISFNIFPNPTRGQVNVRLEGELEVDDDNFDITVFSVSGSIVLSTQSSSVMNTTQLDLSHLPSGNYMVNIRSEYQNTSFLIEKY